MKAVVGGISSLTNSRKTGGRSWTYASVFIAQAYDIDLSLVTKIAMLLTLMLTSKDVAGVPRASLVVIEESLLLILGIDTFLDMGRPATIRARWWRRWRWSPPERVDNQMARWDGENSHRPLSIVYASFSRRDRVSTAEG